MKITAHCLVKNEENFIWYAINSIIDSVDEILVWDQGSVDSTTSIIKEIKSSKIKYRKALGDVSGVRQKMLDETESDWIFILDGDEIWWDESIHSLIKVVNKSPSDIEAFLFPNYMLVGDIFHYQEELAGKYRIAGKIGNYNIRLLRRTDGLHVQGIYPNEAYVNRSGIKIQDLSDDKILFIDKPYFHASFLKRSSELNSKFKDEVGVSFQNDFYFPEVFFRPRPSIVPSPWKPLKGLDLARSFLFGNLRKIKRRI